ncbi:MAG: putative DNA binding domain-containing protein [Clostridia bacterium]|nr:putative DNA binding domain-containing protein [Clostridia bacterium]
MTEQELKILITEIQNQKCEKQHIEIKKAAKGTPERLYDTFSSFSNQTNGGTIIFGIDEKNNYEVCGVYDVQALQVQVTNAALQMEPVIRPFFTVTEFEKGKMVVSAEIAECEPENKPCFYRPAGRIRGAYVRVGEADEPMTEYEIYSFEVYKRKIRDELRTVERATADDFNKDMLSGYFSKLRLEKPQLAKQDETRIMQLQGLTSNNLPTVAGILLFSDYPQAFFPQMSITAMVVDSTEIGRLSPAGERFVDNKRLEGTISQMLDDALAFVRRNIKNAVIIDENGKRTDKPEYPIVAIREIILNALIHRDYSIHTEDSPIRIIIYSNRLVVENPGGLYGRLTVDDLGKIPADTRNPFIAGNLEVILNTENRFSGIPTIYEEMKKAGLKPPVFESIRGNFRVTLYNEKVKEQTNSFADEDTVNNRILHFCKTPKSKEEIAEMLNISTPYYIVSKYLRPLCEQKLLAMTIPEKPKSKHQKYYKI